MFSHVHILECCSEYLDAYDTEKTVPLRRSTADDSAAACARVSESGDITKAAICSREAAVFYNLHILQEHIGNDMNSSSRYLVLCKNNVESGIPHDPLLISSRIALGAEVNAH